MFMYWEKETHVLDSKVVTPTEITCLSWSEARHGKWGWLATGNEMGNIGVTQTRIEHDMTEKNIVKKSYNLRTTFHRSQIIFVKFSKQVNWLASCDINGVICLWYFGNKRWKFRFKFPHDGSLVTDMKWSNNGKLLILCYGSAVLRLIHPKTGRSMFCTLNFEKLSFQFYVASSLCDQYMYVVTDQGQVAIIDVDGVNRYHNLETGESIISHMSYSRDGTLAVGSPEGTVVLLAENGLTFEAKLETGLEPCTFEWSDSSQYLAIVGVESETMRMKVYDKSGGLVSDTSLPPPLDKKVRPTSLSWAHGDRRVVAVVGGRIAVARIVHNKTMSLEELCCIELYRNNTSQRILTKDSLPMSIERALTSFVGDTIYYPIPGHSPSLVDFLHQQIDLQDGCLHCTMYGEESTKCRLFLEHMGDLLPFLEGHPVDKICPKFIITAFANEDHIEKPTIEDVLFRKTYPVAKVVSNIWGTKFEFLSYLTKNKLGKVTYEALLTHIKPRKITIEIPDVVEKENCALGLDVATTPMGENIKIQNCSPIWNHKLGTYQLNCEGRITRVSEKNCRFEFNGVKCLQFGRVGLTTYKLDFGFPFSPIQAFGVALTSLTTRCK